jgi:hypothetical protein
MFLVYIITLSQLYKLYLVEWKRCERKRSWIIPAFAMRNRTKLQRNFSHVNCHPKRESNTGPPEEDTGITTIPSVIGCCGVVSECFVTKLSQKKLLYQLGLIYWSQRGSVGGSALWPFDVAK